MAKTLKDMFKGAKAFADNGTSTKKNTPTPTPTPKKEDNRFKGAVAKAGQSTKNPKPTPTPTPKRTPTPTPTRKNIDDRFKGAVAKASKPKQPKIQKISNPEAYANKLIQDARGKGYSRFGIIKILEIEGSRRNTNLIQYYKTKDKEEIGNQINHWFKEYKALDFSEGEIVSMINNNLDRQHEALNKVYNDIIATADREYQESIGEGYDKAIKSSAYKGLEVSGYKVAGAVEIFPVYKKDDFQTQWAKSIVNNVAGALVSAMGILELSAEGLRQFVIQGNNIMQGKGISQYKKTTVFDDLIPLYLPGRAGKDLQKAVNSIDNEILKESIKTGIEILGDPFTWATLGGTGATGKGTTAFGKLAKGEIITAKAIEEQSNKMVNALYKLNKTKEAKIVKDAIAAAKEVARKEGLKGRQFRTEVKMAKGIAKYQIIDNKLFASTIDNELSNLSITRKATSDEIISAKNLMQEHFDDIVKAKDAYVLRQAKKGISEFDIGSKFSVKAMLDDIAKQTDDVSKNLTTALQDVRKLYTKPKVQPKVTANIGYRSNSTVKANVLNGVQRNNLGTGTIIGSSKTSAGKLGLHQPTAIDLNNYVLYKPATYDHAIKLNDVLGEINKFAERGLNKTQLNNLYKEVKTLFPKTTKDDFMRRLNDVKKYHTKTTKILEATDEADTAGTQFMRGFGFEGVDNRAFSKIDNTIGSIVYDVRTATGELEVVDDIAKKYIDDITNTTKATMDKSKNGAVKTTGASGDISDIMVPIKNRVTISLNNIRKTVDFVKAKVFNVAQADIRTDALKSKILGRQVKGLESYEQLGVMVRDAEGESMASISGQYLRNRTGGHINRIPSWEGTLKGLNKQELLELNKLLLHRHAIDRARYGKFLIAPSVKQLRAIYAKGTPQYNLITDLTNKLKVGNKLSKKSQMQIHQKLSELEVSNIIKHNPRLVKYEGQVRKFINAFCDEWLVNTGRVSKEAMANLRKKYPNWIMAYREIDDDIVRVLTDNPKITSGEYIKTASTSNRRIYQPTQIMEAFVKSNIKKGRFNMYLQMLYKDTKEFPDAFKALGIRRTGTEAHIKDMVKDVDTNLGINPTSTKDALRNKVIAFVEGKPHTLDISNALMYNMLREYHTGRIENAVIKFFHKRVSTPFKYVVTQSNPIFGINNMARDIPFAFITSKGTGVKQLQNSIIGIYDRLRGDEMFELYSSLNGSGGNFFAEGIAKTKNPIIRMNNAIEDFSRFGAFRASLEKSGVVNENSIIKALYDAKNITVDFGRYGSWAKNIDAFVPYFNAAIQGLTTVAKAVKERPLATIAKGMAVYTLPTIALDIYNSTNPYYKKISQYIKDTNFCIPNLFGDKDEKGLPTTFIMLKRDREMGTLFGVLPQRGIQQLAKMENENPSMFNLQAIGLGQLEHQLAKMYYNNPDVWRGIEERLTQSFLPNPSSLLDPIIGVNVTNKDYRGSDIIPCRFDDIKEQFPELVYDDETTETAKFLGKVFNKTPMEIDYLLRSYTGIIYKLAKPIDKSIADTVMSGEKSLDKALIQAGGRLLKEVVAQSFVKDPTYSNDNLQLFYENYDKLQSEYKANKINKDIKVKENLYNGMYNVSSSIAELNKFDRDIGLSNLSKPRKDELTKEIKKEINNLAEFGYKMYLSGEDTRDIKYIDLFGYVYPEREFSSYNYKYKLNTYAKYKDYQKAIKQQLNFYKKSYSLQFKILLKENTKEYDDFAEAVINDAREYAKEYIIKKYKLKGEKEK